MTTQSTANRAEGRVMTLGEVASLLRISRGSAYEAAKRKEIPTIRIGRRLLVPCDALERLLSTEIGAPGSGPISEAHRIGDCNRRKPLHQKGE